MMSKRKCLIHVMVLAVAGLLMCPSTASAQEPDDDAPRRERRRMRRPEKIQQRIDGLIEEGVPEDDRRIQRLRRMLEWMEQEGWPGERGPRGPLGRGPGDFGPRHYSPEEMMEFIEQHPELHRLMMMSPDGREASPKMLRRNLRRSGRQISEIMTAMEEGHPDLADVMIESAKIQFAIRGRVREYHEAPEDSSERELLRDELAELVQKQVATDLAVQGLKLVSLRERIADQEARLAKDRARVDELVAKKLERLLNGKGKRPGPRGRHERFGPKGSPKEFDAESDEDPDR